MATYLTTPKNLIHLFILKADREYFSQPVAVEPLYCELSTRFTFVRDPKRGVTYPVDPRNLKEGKVVA